MGALEVRSEPAVSWAEWPRPRGRAEGVTHELSARPEPTPQLPPALGVCLREGPPFAPESTA